MWLYVLSSFAIVLFNVGLWLVTYNYGYKQKTALAKAYFKWSLFISLWAFGYGITLSGMFDYETTLVWNKLCQSFAAMIAPHFFLFGICVTDEYTRYKRIYAFYYVLGVVNAILLFATPWYVKGLWSFGVFKYQPLGGPLYIVFTLYFYWCTIHSFIIAVQKYKSSVGIGRSQIRLFLWATGIAYFGGATLFWQAFKIPFPPYGVLLILSYVIIIGYAIQKYRFLDVSIILTRVTIFIIVYALVLGLPLLLGYKYGLWQYSTWMMLVLATAGPFIYQYLRQQAEAVLLKEQKQYQKALLAISSNMLLIKELGRLLKTIASNIVDIVRVSWAGIYLQDEKSRKYVLRYKQAREGEVKLPEEFLGESELVRHLSSSRLSLIGEESGASHLKIGLAVPCSVDEVMLGFILLGDKPRSTAYTQDDVNVFTILANQIAMAIENCQFYAQEKERQALLYQSATLAQMGVMADSMGHQIKNHIQKMSAMAGSQAGILEEILKEDISREKAVELLKRHIEIFTKIEAQGKTGGELIASISKFSKLPRGEFKQTTIAEMFATANDMLRFKIKFDRIDYVVDIADNLPRIYAHPILGEAFFNLIDNAYDTVMDREDRLKESGYRGRIAFQARCNDSINVEVKIADNGMGVDKRILEHLFLPFYTTKATANKGTGVGLERVPEAFLWD